VSAAPYSDPLGRPYAGYDCTVCDSPVAARLTWFEDECQGCGHMFPSSLRSEELPSTYDAIREEVRYGKP
jgi:hypothetical protein